MSVAATVTAAAELLAQIPPDTGPITPPTEVTADLEQVGRWFFWSAIAALSMLGVAAGVYLAVSFRRHGELGEGERRVAFVAVGALLAATSGGWAAVIL